MKVLLDTSVCVHVLRRNAVMLERLMAWKARDLGVPAHAAAELEHGIHLAQLRKQSRRRVDELFGRYPVLPFDSAAARRAGLLLFDTGRAGISMKFFDLMIAAQAIASGLVLATADADFEPLAGSRGLKIAKWP